MNRGIREQDVSVVRFIESIEDVHQGGLAGTVLPEKRVNLSSMHLEAHPIISQHTGEALADLTHVQKGRVRSGHGAGGGSLDHPGTIAEIRRIAQAEMCLH